MTDITEYGDIIVNDYMDEWGRWRINGLLEDGTRILMVAAAPIIKTWTALLNTSHVFKTPTRLFKLSQTLRMLHAWTLPLPSFLKQWFAAVQTTHTFRRPFRFMKLTQTLQISHVYIRNRLFKLSQNLNISHVFTRPFRRIGYTQQLQPAHVFRRPVRVVRFPASIQLIHQIKIPTRLIRLVEQLTLGHAYFVAVPSVKKTRLFLVRRFSHSAFKRLARLKS